MAQPRKYLYLNPAPEWDERPVLLRFLALSLLLHAIVVALFGTAVGGGAGRDPGLWGTLDVTLQRATTDAGAGIRRTPGADSAAPGAALLRRLGDALGAGTSSPAVAPDAPAASRAAPTPAPEPPAAPPEPEAAALPPPTQAVPAPPDPPRVAPLVPPPATPPALEPLPRLNMKAPEMVDRPFIPEVAAPTPERSAAPPAVPAAPVVPPPPAEMAAPATLERKPAPDVALRPRETPTPLPLPAPLERITPPTIPRQLAPPISPPPQEAPFVPPAPLERLAPPKVERQLAPPITPPPQEAPFVPPAPLERLAPPKVERQLAPPITAPPAEPPAPVPAPAATGTTVNRAPPAATAPVAPRSAAPAGDVPARLPFGRPEIDAEVFTPRRDVVIPGATTDEPPRIDLDASRRRAREIASESKGSRGALPLLPPPPDDSERDALRNRKPTLSEMIEKAIKPDCRNAYAGLGLLAIPPLIASSIGNGGCNW